jgi:hypothetical protein
MPNGSVPYISCTCCYFHVPESYLHHSRTLTLLTGMFYLTSAAVRTPHSKGCETNDGIARVFRRDSPPTRSRRSECSGGECSSMTSVEGNAVQTFAILL